MFTDRDYHNMVTESWKFFKKYFSQFETDPAVMEKDDWWQALIAEGDALSQKYEECQFIKAQVISIFNEFDAIWKHRAEEAA